MARRQEATRARGEGRSPHPVTPADRDWLDDSLRILWHPFRPAPRPGTPGQILLATVRTVRGERGPPHSAPGQDGGPLGEDFPRQPRLTNLPRCARGCHAVPGADGARDSDPPTRGSEWSTPKITQRLGGRDGPSRTPPQRAGVTPQHRCPVASAILRLVCFETKHARARPSPADPCSGAAGRC